MRIYDRSSSVGFVTNKLATGGYGYTLTTILGELLVRVEEAYGPRDRDWTILGIEFSSDRQQIWYPGNRGHVAIQLTHLAAQDDSQALYQLAHEVVHLLAPTAGQNATVVEEALATLFSEWIASEHDLDIRTPKGKYADARDLLVASGFERHIKSARAERQRFVEWDAQFLKQICPDLPDETAAAFCTPFNDWVP